MTTTQAELFDETHTFNPIDATRGGWAFIEIMGHRNHYGYVREIQLFGTAMCEVLVPLAEGTGFQFRPVYGGSSIFSVTPCEREVCIAKAPRPFTGPRLPVHAERTTDDEDELERSADADENDDEEIDDPPESDK